MSFAKPGPFEARFQDKIIGIFFVLASAALIYSVYLVKSKDRQSDEWLAIHSLVSKSYGLAESAGITISGIDIGKVTTITLQKDAKVRIDMILDPQYSALYKRDSQLKISSGLGIDSVLSGSSMEFIPGDADQLLETGSMITIEEPKSLDDLVEEWELEKLAGQVKGIVSNLQALSENVAGQQEQLNSTLANISDFSGQLVIIAERVPPLLDNVNRTNSALQRSIGSIDKSINTLTEPVKSTLTEAEALLLATKQSMEALQPAIERAKVTLETLEPTFERAPLLVESLNETSNSVSRLTNRLSQHWLLGDAEKEPESSYQVRYQGDRDLYEGM